MDIGTAIQTGGVEQFASFPHSVHSLTNKEKAEEISIAKEKITENADRATLFASDNLLLAAAEESAGKKPADGDSTFEQSQSEDLNADTTKLREPDQLTSPSGEVMSATEQREVETLKRRDTEVRAHEQAHLSAAGNLSRGSASFDYEMGPDGKRYAVGGEVSIDTSPVSGDPQATLIKAQKIRRAATAPADPSSQDRSVAAEASRMEAQARTEISQQARDKQSESVETSLQNESKPQDIYRTIQNNSVLKEQTHSIDFFI